MLLYCPQCNTGYEIEPNLIPDNGKKMRCAKCGKIWRCKKEDLQEEIPVSQSEEEVKSLTSTQVPEEAKENQLEEVPEADQSESTQKSAAEVEMEDIFARLSTQTKDLFQQEQNLPLHKKIGTKVKHALGLDKKGILKYYILFLCLVTALGLFAIRYEVVRAFPQAERIYSMLGVESRVIGEGLEFQNIIRNEYEEDYVRKLEIKGYIVNTNQKTIAMPLIHVEIMDKDTNLLQAVDDETPISELGAGEKQMFRIVITQPSALAKYVLLTFSPKKKSL